ncbi:MAG: LysM peptidoglycan-binding domain-containing protein [Lachnospirales bacterium]
MTNEEIKLPVNVKQIGTISDNSIRIYMEDYVKTYIEQYSSSDVSKEKIAILIGKKLTIENEQVIFVSGAVQGRYTIRKNGMLNLTEKSWQYIKKQMSLYFNDLSVIGWVYVQPGFEDYISEGICSFQKENMYRGLDILFITDPSENINSFYLWNNENMMFNQIKGYIIYYEKNEGMHEYMLENKIKKPKKEEENIISDAGAKARAVASNKKSKYKNRLIINSDSRKMINLLGGVSFVMLMVCFVMGAGLVQNDERLSELEEKLYFLEAGIKESQAVFASQQLTETTTIPTTQAPTTTQIQTTEAQVKKYVVKEGDTLIKICKNIYGSPANINKIKELNKLNDSTIVVGDTLILP